MNCDRRISMINWKNGKIINDMPRERDGKMGNGIKSYWSGFRQN